MGKSKKIKKGAGEESDSDVENSTNDLIEKPQTKNFKSAKPHSVKETKQDDKKTKSKKAKEDSDESEPDIISNVKTSFALLQVDDGDSDNDAQPIDDEESDTESKPTKKDSKKKPSDENRSAKEGGKKGKRKGKKRDDSDDEIEKVLAELEMEYSGGATIQKDSNEDQQPESKKEKTKAKKEEKETDEVESSGTVKTAAQKKKEKKEREKQKKMASKKQDGVKEEPSEPLVDRKSSEDAPITEEKDDNDQEAEKKGKKNKKKKGGKEEEEVKEKEKDPKKGPGKKTIAAMQEALKKLKEEEEQQRKEAEERLKREEEAENARLEAIRLEKEKKEKKKQKEKERKERLKAEGKLLTAKQKADRARAQAMIDNLKAQGVELPDVGERKPRPGTRIRPSKQKKDQAPVEKSTSEEPRPEIQEPAKEETNEPDVQETPKEEEEVEAEDVKDAWDASSSDEGEDSQETSVDTALSEANIDASKERKAQAASGKGDEDEDETSSEEDDSESDESDTESENDDDRTAAEKARDKAIERIKLRKENAEKNKSPDNLRAAIVCVLGHVDTGKTKILDKLRRTNVQDGEAGGITQQIGATNVPIDAIREQIKIVKGANEIDLKIPGLLIIDTPGHESFSNLRSRGSSLCDIAILVVDIMHGLEPQTLESINLLKTKKTPFIVALNKIDRLYDWQTISRKDVRDILKAQAQNTQLEFEQRTKEVIVQFAEQGLNAALFYENPDMRSYVSLVPTSAITGEGMGNLLALIVEFCQSKLTKRLMYSDELQATVLEVKAIPGLGTTIDVILVNGTLREGDTMLCAGTDGPIVTQIRSLLMPQPMKELRVKNAYIEYKEIKAAQGVKIAAKELEKAIAGLNLYIANKPDEVEIITEEVSKELKSALSKIKLADRGVYVQASTLGSLEALLEFLRTSKIPYSGIRIGPVVKKDVMKASIMLEHESQYATILAFDVKIERDAQELADSLGVRIFQADIIYHLFDKFTAYREELKQRKREEFKHVAVFPCKLKILPQFVFNSRDPIVVGVIIEAGIVKEGTPICVPSKEFVDLGVVTSIESNHKNIDSARKGMEVCIKIEPVPGESPKMFGRHFDETDFLISKISRQSIDACKDYFRDDLQKTDWALMVELKKLFQIL
ncbi:unnamed protein product [Phyllotreta striolata]|uniref:Eukaryotic translation initiation factor 5B n=1 Tax=Phyllotreta striolata TaxID=444603 RepID=A0A9N9XMG7_PHYSR|nr:unnamed protein product [Phyllotreta striolata]